MTRQSECLCCYVVQEVEMVTPSPFLVTWDLFPTTLTLQLAYFRSQHARMSYHQDLSIYRRRPVQTTRISSTIDPSKPSTPTPPTVRVRIASTDDAVYNNMLANMNRLLRVAQDTEEPATTSALLAKKALRYRNILARAQNINVDDPSFDVASFMGVARATQVSTRG